MSRDTAPEAHFGSRAHIIYTIVVFVVLASLDNAAIALIPSMVPQLETTFDVERPRSES